MASSVFKDGFPSAHLTTRERVESSIDLRRLFAVIDADPAIAGAGVVYLDAQLWPVTLREFQPICSVLPKRVILREMPRSMARLDFVRALEEEPRESQLVFEALGMGVACGSAVLGWIVAVSGTAAIPFTAGASSFIAAVGYISATASLAQCVIGGYRVYNELYAPMNNDLLDSKPWFQHATAALDAAALVGAGSSLLATIRLVKVTKTSTGKSSLQVLKGLTRQERAKLTKELLSIQHPQLASKMLKLRQLAGDLPKRLTPTQLRHATLTQIKDVVGASMTVMGSSMSGNIHTIAVGLYEEFSE
ncbi:NAD synthetase [Pseudomonas sp. AMR01]|uniref:NAD synthetase n=1 Tax=Pseudomonas sp. AMR01 TaxID=3064904 RepID=UPI0035C24684